MPDALVQITLDIMDQVVAACRELVGLLKANPDADTVDVPDTVVFWALFSNPTFHGSPGSQSSAGGETGPAG